MFFSICPTKSYLLVLISAYENVFRCLPVEQECWTVLTDCSLFDPPEKQFKKIFFHICTYKLQYVITAITRQHFFYRVMGTHTFCICCLRSLTPLASCT